MKKGVKKGGEGRERRKEAKERKEEGGVRSIYVSTGA
jgi:hypothetical protein